MRKVWAVILILFIGLIFVNPFCNRGHRDGTKAIIPKKPELPNWVMGKTIWIWNLDLCEGGNADKILAKALDNGLDGIIVKTAISCKIIHTPTLGILLMSLLEKMFDRLFRG